MYAIQAVQASAVASSLATSSPRVIPPPVAISPDTSPEGNAILVKFYNALQESEVIKPVFRGTISEQASQIREWLNGPDAAKITCLYLSNKNLTALPPEIGKFTNLFMIILDNNYLEKLPESIGNCMKLGTILVANNRLNELPESIGNLKKLSYLDLSNNRLITLPVNFIQLSGLQELRLQNNRSLVLPSEMNNLRSLGMIILDENVKEQMPTYLQEQFRDQFLKKEIREHQLFQAQVNDSTK